MDQGENLSFAADVFPHLEPRDLPTTIEGVLGERIDRYYCVVKIAEGDGNCLFRALSKVLKKKQKHHLVMREELVKEMRKHKDIYMKFALTAYPEVSEQPYFDEYLKRMSKEGEWGDIICILAAANLFAVRIIVISSVDVEFAWEVAPTHKKSKKDVFLSYLYYNQHNAHYNALFPRKEVPPVDPNSPSPSDRRAFVRSYHVSVDNIPRSITTQDLREKASAYGEVLDAFLSTEEGTPGITGLVRVANKESMENVIAHMNGEVWDGMIVEVQEAMGLGSPYDHGY